MYLIEFSLDRFSVYLFHLNEHHFMFHYTDHLCVADNNHFCYMSYFCPSSPFIITLFLHFPAMGLKFHFIVEISVTADKN